MRARTRDLDGDAPFLDGGMDSMMIPSIPFPGLAGARPPLGYTSGGAVAERAWCRAPRAGRGRWMDCSWVAAMTACATLRSTVVLPFVFLWLSSRWKGQVGDTKPYVPDGSLCGLVWRSFCWGKVASFINNYVRVSFGEAWLGNVPRCQVSSE